MASKRGRPSKYTPEIAALICERIAAGESVRSICRKADMPGQTAVFAWLATHEDFAKQYARAKEAGCDALAEEALEVGRSATAKTAHAARVHLDAIRWYAGKIAPKKYGDKLELSGTVSLAGALEEARRRRDGGRDAA